MTLVDTVQAVAFGALLAIVTAALVSSRHKGDVARQRTRRITSWAMAPFAVYLAAVAADRGGNSRYLLAACALLGVSIFIATRRRNRR